MFTIIMLVTPITLGVIIIFLLLELRKTKKDLREKEVRLIQFYLDKRFLKEILNKNFQFPHSKKYASFFLNKVKDFFHLEEITMLSLNELEKNEYLSFLFKADITKTIFLFEPEDEVTAICKTFDVGINTEPKHGHKLYVYLPINQKNWRDQKNLIHVKIPYTLTKDEHDSLDLSIGLYRMFSEQK